MSSFLSIARKPGEGGQTTRGHDGSQVMIPTGFGVGKSKGSAEELPVEKYRGGLPRIDLTGCFTFTRIIHWFWPA